MHETAHTSRELPLLDGRSIPSVGFGTYRLKGAEGAASIRSALAAGYRLLDTAYNYENEGTVGRALADSEVAREQVSVVSKLPGRYHQRGLAGPAVEESLYRLGLDLIDLYLIHWPNPSQDHYVEAWEALIEARDQGLVKSIGVCNFLPAHILRLEEETGVVPVVNQIELHPYFPQDDLVEFDRAHGIVTEAWSPLARAHSLFGEPALIEIANRLERTVAQVVLRWHLQRGVVAIPKSASPDRQRANLALDDFELTAADMAAIATLAKPDGRMAGQDPARYEEF